MKQDESHGRTFRLVNTSRTDNDGEYLSTIPGKLELEMDNDGDDKKVM